jgi:hypothetical protein
MAEQEFRYNLNTSIQITGTETKKNNVRDALLALLQDAVDNGQIDRATWSVTQNTIPEGGVIG